MPRIRLHDVRHTYATLALKAGVHAKVVSERLGHSSIAITLDLYSHVTPGMARGSGRPRRIEDLRRLTGRRGGAGAFSGAG